jgi:demethoxyubiquinone hydroxylase (CLK1/Coq7/Cat5 family)
LENPVLQERVQPSMIDIEWQGSAFAVGIEQGVVPCRDFGMAGTGVERNFFSERL